MRPPSSAINGPIPGENLLSDKRNYPWHRAPEIDNLNDGMEALMENLSKRKVAAGVLTLLEIMPISMITQLFLMKGIERGKWTMDMALLLAGPLSHMLVIIARKYDIKYRMGIVDEDDFPLTTKTIKKVAKLTSKKQEEVEEEIQKEVLGEEGTEGKKPPTGFMALIPSGTSEE